MKSLVFNGLTLALLLLAQTRGAEMAPSTVFDLHNWKLQIPGPKEIKVLQNHSSAYFHLNQDKEMCFHVNAAETGTTPNAHYVRSELRHLPNWKTSETHSLSADLRVASNLKPDKVTVLQIHGITEQGADAPPLLRVAVNNGNLVAVIKTTDAGDQNETVTLLKGLGTRPVKIDVTVNAKKLTISVNGEGKLSRDLSYWKFFNYFKAGCYPQTTEGTVDVMFRKLTAN